MYQHRLLIIDDNKDIADVVHRVAVKAGFDVHAINDAAEIPSIYDGFLPHIIVLDIFMPGMDGFEVLHFLHQRNSSSHIVLLSGQAGYRPMASRMGNGLELAIVATLAKPFRIAVLRETLEKIKRSLPIADESSLPKMATGLKI